MRGLRVHLTLLLATAVWSVLLGNKAALVGREADEESSVLPAAQRMNTHTNTHTHRIMCQSQVTRAARLRFCNKPTPAFCACVHVCVCARTCIPIHMHLP